MRIDIATRAPESWGPFAAQHASFYHRPEWIHAIASTFRYPLQCLTATDGDDVLGAMAIAEVPALAGPRRLVSFPFSYAAGPCARSPDVALMLLEQARRDADHRRIRRLEIKRWPTCSDVLAPGFERIHRYATYVSPTATIDDPGALLSSSTRRGVRQAAKAGIVVAEEHDAAAWRIMWRLQVTTAHAHGVPAPPPRFFTHACRELQRLGCARLLLARTASGVPAAGIVLYLAPGRWIYAFGAADPSAVQLRPTHAVLWEAATAAHAAGADLDLGRAAPEQQGLVEFKRRWGGIPVPLAYDYWPRAGGLHAARRGRGTGGLVSRLWARMPVALARLGGPLFRYLG